MDHEYDVRRRENVDYLQVSPLRILTVNHELLVFNLPRVGRIRMGNNVLSVDRLDAMPTGVIDVPFDPPEGRSHGIKYVLNY